MLSEPHRKYRSFPPVDLPDRHWPQARLTRAPTWASTDLRDGNQALFEPMNLERKLRFFRLLCEIGFNEIEVGFPSASQTEFDFVRLLIEGGHIPERVTIGVLTPAREPLIERTIAALRGAPRAIVHVYNATSPHFRAVVFALSEQQVVDMAVRAVEQVRGATDALPETRWQLEYSPETFSATELPFALRVCDAVTQAWDAGAERRVILNLPATVELATPNVYADQIEWMHRHLARRESVVLSVHPHNDRGCAVAAAELAQMAGAERVEGCLFGNGERTGNVDLVTLALNLYTQGIDPGLDFSDIHRVARSVEHCNQLPVHPRHPYAGDLVFTAFSGSHQDAIRKGMAVQAAQPTDTHWEVPYLPIDPKDVGRSYDALVRINSQSGKGGIAFLLEQDHGLVLPRRLQVEFSGRVQREADALGGEISSTQLWDLFAAEYLQAAAPVELLEHRIDAQPAASAAAAAAAATRLSARLRVAGHVMQLHGEGNGPIAALAQALQRRLQLPLLVHSYEERARGAGAAAQAVTFIELSLAGSTVSRFGVGLHANLLTSALQGFCSALNRLLQALPDTQRQRWLQRALRAAHDGDIDRFASAS
ncbi:MAG TPA: 2-isopropylmalate synthase [Steroidobacteraceae bacterium]|nr:2-isopropylmalate synthase [Steroidobacteraceae bacterium]